MLLAGLFLGVVALVSSQELPTLYQYYTEGGITEGLQALPSGFTLNTRPITLYSGSIHYYRVHPDYWRDRLRKARAAGLNAIETYVPWNLHEPQVGVYDFGEGGNDYSALLDIRRFLQIAQEEDLFVLLRPGPFICGELEFGGLPSWLLRYPDIKVRTSDPTYTSHVSDYFDQLLSRVSDLQFNNNGPIIAMQIENEYGAFGPPDEPRDRVYLDFIRNRYQANDITELFFTSDTPANTSDLGALPGVLQTANFNTDPEIQFDLLRELQPDKPVMAMEYWTGWFDHWFEGKHNLGNSPQDFARYLETIFNYNGSVNFYMFHGGTSFGYLNGANVIETFPYYVPDVTSYDYNAPITEAGDYTEKYALAKEMIAANNPVKTKIPAQPVISTKTAYPSVQISEMLTYTQLIDQVPRELWQSIENVTSMELLDINGNSGQSFGLINYRKTDVTLDNPSQLQIMGHVRDVAMILVNDEQKTSRPRGIADLFGFGYWPAKDAKFSIKDVTPGNQNTLDIIVENCGRNNFGQPKDFDQRKGLFEGSVFLDGNELTDWTAIPLELKTEWVQSLVGWTPTIPGEELMGPLMMRATFNINDEPTDTFLNMGAWSKGAVFVNGFPLGRYFHIGPQITNYVPAPVLKQGENEIIVFEHYVPASEIVFTDTPILDGP